MEELKIDQFSLSQKLKERFGPVDKFCCPNLRQPFSKLP
jgi:hypothetical protein